MVSVLFNGAASLNTCPMIILQLKFQWDRLNKGFKLSSKKNKPQKEKEAGKKTKTDKAKDKEREMAREKEKGQGKGNDRKRTRARTRNWKTKSIQVGMLSEVTLVRF